MTYIIHNLPDFLKRRTCQCLQCTAFIDGLNDELQELYVDMDPETTARELLDHLLKRGTQKESPCSPYKPLKETSARKTP